MADVCCTLTPRALGFAYTSYRTVTGSTPDDFNKMRRPAGADRRRGRVPQVRLRAFRDAVWVDRRCTLAHLEVELRCFGFGVAGFGDDLATLHAVAAPTFSSLLWA